MPRNVQTVAKFFIVESKQPLLEKVALWRFSDRPFALTTFSLWVKKDDHCDHLTLRQTAVDATRSKVKNTLTSDLPFCLNDFFPLSQKSRSYFWPDPGLFLFIGSSTSLSCTTGVIIINNVWCMILAIWRRRSRLEWPDDLCSHLTLRHVAKDATWECVKFLCFPCWYLSYHS